MMKINVIKFFAFIIFIAFYSCMYGQTIAEKKSGKMSQQGGGDLTRDMQAVLREINKEMLEDQAALKELYQQVMVLYQNHAPEESYQQLLEHIQAIRSEIDQLESNWREMVTQTGQEGSYALWHQPESTLGQLVIDYGSQNYVYLVPPDITAIKVSIDSNIPIPRASWNEMMELILTQNGVGIKQLNPYLRQLYLIKNDKSTIKLITNSRQELEFLPPDTRICFVLSPEPEEVRRIWAFLDKFINPQNTVLQAIGRDILIIAPVADVIDLLKLYDFVSINKGDKDYKIRSLSKVDADEMAKILGVIFDQFVESPRVVERGPERPGERPPGIAPTPPKGLVEPRPLGRESPSGEVNGLKIIALKHLAQAIFLVGTKEEIKKAEQIIDQVESQIGEARERVIWWYTAKHSDPEELAKILEKIYVLMVQTGTGREGRQGPPPPYGQQPAFPPDLIRREGNTDKIDLTVEAPVPGTPLQILPNPFTPTRLYTGDFYQQGGYVVNPAPVQPRIPTQPVANQNRNNFLVDLKTGAIVMVVEADILPKIKELIKKLDVPKKMVQIEALVFEKRLTRQDNFGLNLFRFGDVASNTNVAGLLWNNLIGPTPGVLNPPNNAGIFDYILSRKAEHGVPAFDIIYRFLITQEDVQINANPRVVALNQTPATISIVEEISINSGIFLFNTGAGITPETSFTRAQYGITIVVTPTIHFSDERDPLDDTQPYVTLDTDITFDTFTGSATSGQPDVTRRHVTNQVSIPDGQTVVIGGLRRKNTDDAHNAIPYLGEIPGFGKLFSTTSMTEDALDLFIFLTPKIISDPSDDFDRLRAEDMLRRPGDIPEFMCALTEAELMEKNRLYAGTLNALFGRPPERCVPENILELYCPPMGVYDGR